MRTRRSALPLLVLLLAACDQEGGGACPGLPVHGLEGTDVPALCYLAPADCAGGRWSTVASVYDGDTITLSAMPDLGEESLVKVDMLSTGGFIPGKTLKEMEREAIVATIGHCGGSTRNAAELLGISVRKVQYKLKEYEDEDQRLRERSGEQVF